MTPWSRGDVVRLTVGIATGGIVVAVAWNGAATRSQLDDQTGFIVFGGAGLFVAVLAQSLWLRRGRRAVAAYAATVQATAAVLVDQPPARPVSGGGRLVATAGMRHFHRPDCPITAGQGWSAEPRHSHEAAGRRPCGICTP